MELNVAPAFLVNLASQISILKAVLLLQRSQLDQLVLEVDCLCLELVHFVLALEQVGLFVLEVLRLGVHKRVELVESGELLGDGLLKNAGLSFQVLALTGFECVLMVQSLDLLRILAVALSEILELLLKLFFLLHQLVVNLNVLGQLRLQS